MVLFLCQANDFSELFVSHNTWTGYFTMLRVAKEYDLPVRDAHGADVAARKTLFPGDQMVHWLPGESRSMAHRDHFQTLQLTFHDAPRVFRNFVFHG